MPKENEVAALVQVLENTFQSVAVRHDYGWPGKPAVCVLDCVLSLNRNYDRMVLPRIRRFLRDTPDIVALAHLQALMETHEEVGDFCRIHLSYRDPRRERTLRGVVGYLLREQEKYPGESEWERLQAWAMSAHPGTHRSIGVPGFALSGVQYLRMLLGVQTAKPDVHIIRFVSRVVGRPVNDVTALLLLEAACAQIGLPLREVDVAIWQAGARPQIEPPPAL